MMSILRGLSYLGLALTLLPSFVVFQGGISLDAHKWLMFLGTLLWFVTAAFTIKDDGA